jgi:hypothetical protein
MRKDILILAGILLAIPMVFSIMQDPRTLTDLWYYIPNYTNCLGNSDGLTPIPIEGTCENLWMFIFTNNTPSQITTQLIPAPNMTCYRNNQNCPLTGYYTNMSFKADIQGTFLPFGMYIGGAKSSNHSVDVGSCWNWWNTTDEELRRYQRSFCPITTISFGRFDKGAVLWFWWADVPYPFGTAQPDTFISFKGYGGTMFNVDNMYSPDAQSMFSAIRSYLNISLSLWRILYYFVMIVFIITGIFFVLGVLPMGLRWIIKKITED